LLNGSAVVVAAYLYDAYGNLLSSAGSVTNPLLYRGEWYDAVGNLYETEHRTYNPATGRFDSV